jgi:protein ImuB
MPERQPLILFAPSGRGKICVTACSSSARRFDVVPGMLLAEAQASCPPTDKFPPIFEEHDIAADRERLRQLAIWCQQFSPLAAIDTLDPPDCLLLDLTGCGYGFGGEEGLASTIIDELRQLGFWARGVIADTVGAAWAVAHFGDWATRFQSHPINAISSASSAPLPQLCGGEDTGEGDSKRAIASNPLTSVFSPRSLGGGNEGCETMALAKEIEHHLGRPEEIPSPVSSPPKAGERTKSEGRSRGQKKGQPSLGSFDQGGMSAALGGHGAIAVPVKSSRAIANSKSNTCPPKAADMPPRPDGSQVNSQNWLIFIPPGRHVEALRPLNVGSLRLSPEVVQLLREFDIRRVGQLLDLPRMHLPSRFGQETLLRLDQAIGKVPELLTPERPVEIVEASWTFEPYIDDRQILETVLGRLLEEVLAKLQPRQIGVRRLLCSLTLSCHDPIHFPIGLSQPSLSLRHMMDLLRLHLERQQIPAEVMAIALRAAMVAPLEFRQGQMFEGDDGSGRWREVASLLERLSGRLGEQSVLRPKLNPDPQPEFACRCEPWLTSPALTRQNWSGDEMQPSSSDEEDSTPSRPIYLKDEPLPIDVVSVIPDGPPIQFHWSGKHYVVSHYWGPERIETGWWRGSDVRRDYYLVETTVGERFWIFRTITEEDWFLHGVFA